MWLHTQVQKHYNNADWEAFKWNWLLGIRLFDLRNTHTKINYNGQYILMNKLNIYNNAMIESKSEENNAPVDINEVDLSLDTWLTDDRLPNSDERLPEQHWNYTLNGQLIFTVTKTYTAVDSLATMKKGDQIIVYNGRQFFTRYVFVVHDLRQKIAISIQENGQFENPLYSPELQHYFSSQWWGNIVLWGNLIKRVAERERRTTATVEVNFNICKTFEIRQRNVDIDEYLYKRAHTLNGSQLLVAEKLLFKEYVLTIIVYFVLRFIKLNITHSSYVDP